MNYKTDLVNNILPFWLDNAVDYEHGGIYTSIDKEGRVYDTEKSVWFQGRALWVFAKAYNLIDKNPEYLTAAKTIYSFLDKCTDCDGRMFFSVKADGTPTRKRRYYFSETFAAIGCAELYKATGDERVLADAKKYFDIAYKCFLGEIKTEPKYINLETKALSPVMIMLATAQVMRTVDEKYNAVAKACLDEILSGGYLTDNALLECVNKDGSFCDTAAGRTVNPGHSLEAAWFVMTEGILTNNRNAITAAKKIIDITLPLGLDKKHGGIIAFTDVNGAPPAQLEWDMKLWWPQCEAMIALRLAHLTLGDENYNSLYLELKDYCKKHFVDSEAGEWYGYLHYDNTPSTTLKGNLFKGPFHIPRLYMIMSVLDDTQNISDFMN